ncbi:hypothetical protein BDV96DRAFT_464154, partial [Lophiotrema nucula]
LQPGERFQHHETKEKEESRPDIAQRIEKRLWKYQSSSHVATRWLLEIISWILSALCMGTIIVVLLIRKDQRVPHWPMDLSINTFIAVLSRIASAALVLPVTEALGQLKWNWFQHDSKKMWDFEIFDNASRGPWGSFLLLIRTKCRTLASLGAVIVIIALAMDPFFQQVVSYPSLWELQADSSLPQVFRYDPARSVASRGGQKIIEEDPDLARVAEKFFHGNGTQPIPAGNGTRPEIPLSCPTSNCTWPIYETLGICSKCADVSELLNRTCLRTTIDWTADLGGLGTEATYPNGTVCGYFLNATSDNPVLVSGYLVNDTDTTVGEALLMRILPLITRPLRRPLFGGSVKFKHVRNPIFDHLIIGAANGPESVYKNETPIAQECVLAWCVKSLKSSYYWAQYQEEEMGEPVWNTTQGPFPFNTSRLVTPAINGTEVFYFQNISVEAFSSRFNTSVTYGVSNSTQLLSILAFDDLLPAFVTVANASAPQWMRDSLQNKAPLLRKLDFNPWIYPNNVTRHLERLAKALTDVVRSASNTDVVTGDAFNRETFVAVQWEWLSLPLGLLLLSFVFLLGTMRKSSRERDQVGIWKTSAVATLLYGLPDELLKKIRASTPAGTPRTKAKTLRVKMLPKKGWRISG